MRMTAGSTLTETAGLYCEWESSKMESVGWEVKSWPHVMHRMLPVSQRNLS